MQTEQPAITGSTLFESSAPQPGGGRGFAIAGALVIGLLSGFAGGFVFGQRSGSVPELSAGANVPTPAEEAFTEAAIAEPAPRPVEPAPAPEPVAVAPSVITPVAPPTEVVDGPGTLQIASRPDGAQVFLDGVSIGKTPLVVPDVRAGARRVRLELAGHRTWATVVNVEPGTRARVGASLER